MRFVTTIGAAALLMAAPAAAEITFEGEARMGLAYDSGDNLSGGARNQIVSQQRLTITKSIQTDGGITFQAVIDVTSDNLPGPWQDRWGARNR